MTQLFSKPSTEGYPFTPKEAPIGYRGRIVFHADQCISCGMCERVCAGGAISTSSEETEDGILVTRRFFLGSCTFCNTCADFCVKHAIELTQDYHMVARCEDDLVVTGTYLKKKPVKKAPPAACGEMCIRDRLQAPDVAIAEAAVGVVLTTIIFVVALRKTGGKGEDEK